MIRDDVQLDLRSRSAGFTLVELMVTVVIMGIVSVAVIPAMDNVRSMRSGAARDDLVRYIHVARGRAVASGTPRGIQVDLADSSLTMVRLDRRGAVEPEIDPLTNADRTVDLSELYPGVGITDMTNGDGIGGSGIVWFDFESNPMTYNTASRVFTLNTQSVTISLSSGERVVIYPYSGTIEVQSGGGI